MKTLRQITRRHFIEAAGRTVVAVGAGSILAGEDGLPCLAAEGFLPPIAVFSKVYQELKLDFEQSAAITAEAGLDGVDCPVRPAGEILPEHAADRLPQYAEALAKHGVRMLLLTTTIQGVNSPHAEGILSTGKKLGIRYYRLGYWRRQKDVPVKELCVKIKSSLKDLAAMNGEIGVCALVSNHSSRSATAGFVGGDLGELYDIVKDFNPDEIAVAFDLAHAIITHGDEWRTHFQRLKEHIRIVYVKDVQRSSGLVPFGQGEVGKTDFFQLLVKMNYRAPVSMHIEYDWAPGGKKTRATLLETLTRSRRMLGQWWKGA
jgi:sugar phosphate isomerase/epimerase